MTKRFTGEFDKQYSGVYDNGEQLTNFEVVDFLNRYDEVCKMYRKDALKAEKDKEKLLEDRDYYETKCSSLETGYLKLQRENEQLKIIRSDLVSELNIVQNELNIAIDNGFAPSIAYKEYMNSKKTEYDKFWENKIKTHNNRLKELEE